MAQIQSPETYADGQQVTAARLNNQTNGAILLPGAVTDQTAISGGVASGDAVIVHDASTSALRKATVGEVLGGGVPVVASSVTGVAGADLVLTPSAGQKVDVAGNLEADDINATDDMTVGGNATVTGTLAVNGNSTLGATSVTSLTVDGKTPMTIQDNLTKSYVKVGVASGATGGGVENLVYQTPVLTVPSDETWTYEVWVQTTSGNVNGQTRPDYGSVQLRVYNNATLLATVNGSTSPYGGHTATHAFAVAFTSANSSPQLALKTFNTWGLNEQPRFMVRLTKVKTSTLSDASSCI